MGQACSCQEAPDLSSESTCLAQPPGCRGLEHTPAGSDQSRLLLFSTPPGRGGPGPWDLGERSAGIRGETEGGEKVSISGDTSS